AVQAVTVPGARAHVRHERGERDIVDPFKRYARIVDHDVHTSSMRRVNAEVDTIGTQNRARHGTASRVTRDHRRPARGLRPWLSARHGRAPAALPRTRSRG